MSDEPRYEVTITRWQVVRWAVPVMIRMVYRELPWYRWPQGLWVIVRYVVGWL